MGALSVSELRFAGYILISFLQTRLNPQCPRPAMIRIAVGGPTCPDRTPIIITPTGPVPMHTWSRSPSRVIAWLAELR
jgi:hypothetical protein